MSYFHPKELNVTHENLEIDYFDNEITRRDIFKKIDGIANSNKQSSQKVEIEGDYIKSPKTFYEITLPNKKPNLNWDPLKPSGFTARRLHLYGLLHNNIADVTDNNQNIIGELIIEHRPKTALNQKIFSCYLLEFSDEDNNNLDALVSYIDSNDDKPFELQLNTLTGKQTEHLTYESEYDIVFVFMKTIPINNQSKDFIKNNLTTSTSLFTVSAPSKSYLNKLGEPEVKKTPKTDEKDKENESGSQETFIGSMIKFGNLLYDGKTVEGNTNIDDVYMECELLDESDEKETAYVASQLKSSDSQKDQAIQFYKLISNFFLFIFLIVVSYMLIPSAYRELVLKGVVKWQMVISPDIATYHKYIQLVEYLILFIAFCYVMDYFRIGLTVKGKEIFTMFGILLVSIIAFGVAIIRIKKKTDIEFLTVEVNKRIVKLMYGDNEKIDFQFIDLFKLPFELASFGYLEGWKLFIPYMFTIMSLFSFIFFGLLKIKDGGFWTAQFLYFNLFVLYPSFYTAMKVNKEE